MTGEPTKSWLEKLTDWPSARDRVIRFAGTVLRMEAAITALVDGQKMQQASIEKQSETFKSTLPALEARIMAASNTIQDQTNADLVAIRAEIRELREAVSFIQGQQDIIRSLLERDRRN